MRSLIALFVLGAAFMAAPAYADCGNGACRCAPTCQCGPGCACGPVAYGYAPRYYYGQPVRNVGRFFVYRQPVRTYFREVRPVRRLVGGVLRFAARPFRGCR